jgi:hypothetical protein
MDSYLIAPFVLKDCQIVIVKARTGTINCVAAPVERAADVVLCGKNEMRSTRGLQQHGSKPCHQQNEELTHDTYLSRRFSLVSWDVYPFPGFIFEMPY